MQYAEDEKLVTHRPLPLLQFLLEREESVEFRGENNWAAVKRKAEEHMVPSLWKSSVQNCRNVTYVFSHDAELWDLVCMKCRTNKWFACYSPSESCVAAMRPPPWSCDRSTSWGDWLPHILPPLTPASPWQHQDRANSDQITRELWNKRKKKKRKSKKPLLYLIFQNGWLKM